MHLGVLQRAPGACVKFFALFTAKMVTNPFVAAKFTYLMTEKGPIRRFPVELTMANTLPVRLAQPLRAGKCRGN